MTGDPAGDIACDFDVVSATDLSRHYGRRRALWRVSLAFRAGTITGLFGPNGAGKSTLLGVLSTLALQTSGEVRYGPRTRQEWGDPLRARVGVLGHDLFLYADLTARENLRFFGTLYGVGDLDARVQGALEMARLDHRADDRVSGYSRGMRQRLALERALLHRPRFVLLDEPFTGLDDASAALLVDRLRRLRDDGAIVVLATHDFDLADGLVDDAVCLLAGRAGPIEPGDGSLRMRYRRAMEGAA